jgi:hypothetical protein
MHMLNKTNTVAASHINFPTSAEELHQEMLEKLPPYRLIYKTSLFLQQKVPGLCMANMMSNIIYWSIVEGFLEAGCEKGHADVFEGPLEVSRNMVDCFLSGLVTWVETRNAEAVAATIRAASPALRVPAGVNAEVEDGDIEFTA